MAEYELTGDDLEQMYQEFILETARKPHGKTSFAADITHEPGAGPLVGQTTADAAPVGQVSQVGPVGQDGPVGQSTAYAAHESCVMAQSHQFNPTCGDEVTVRVNLTDGSDGREPTIESVVWDGQGCSISQASLSVMTDLVSGKTVDQFTDLDADFHALMNSRGKGLDDEAVNEALGEATAFQGVSQYPMRIKCALLGWAAVKDSIAQALTQIGEK